MMKQLTSPDFSTPIASFLLSASTIASAFLSTWDEQLCHFWTEDFVKMFTKSTAVQVVQDVHQCRLKLLLVIVGGEVVNHDGDWQGEHLNEGEIKTRTKFKKIVPKFWCLNQGYQDSCHSTDHPNLGELMLIFGNPNSSFSFYFHSFDITSQLFFLFSLLCYH